MQLINPKPEPARYAGFVARVVAFVIDMLCIGIARSFLALLFGFPVFAKSHDIIWFGSVFGLVYFIVMESSKYQATVGKLAMRLRVVNLNGDRISLSDSIVRNLSKMLSAVVVFIGFLMVAMDDRKRALHDRIAGTYVIETQ